MATECESYKVIYFSSCAKNYKSALRETCRNMGFHWPVYFHIFACLRFWLYTAIYGSKKTHTALTLVKESYSEDYKPT